MNSDPPWFLHLLFILEGIKEHQTSWKGNNQILFGNGWLNQGKGNTEEKEKER